MFSVSIRAKGDLNRVAVPVKVKETPEAVGVFEQIYEMKRLSATTVLPDKIGLHKKGEPLACSTVLSL